MTSTALPQDYELRIERIAIQLDSLDNALAAAAAYGASQPTPDGIARFVRALYAATKTLHYDPTVFHELEGCQIPPIVEDAQQPASLLEARVVTRIMLSLIGGRDKPRFGFSKG